MKYIIGIDEVGRGPLAGPVTVGVVICDSKLYTKLRRDKLMPPVGKDSKKLSPEARKKYALVLKRLRSLDLDFAVVHISNKIIDKKGISFAIKKAMTLGLVTLQKRIDFSCADCDVLLDGGLKAPQEFPKQKTIIKGDEKEQIIAWTSILAKVTRDVLMKGYSKAYPDYKFEINKGYGTLKHRTCIRNLGLTKIHRRSFCKRLI